MKLPFYFLRTSGPLNGLLDHFEPISKGFSVIDEALKEYLARGHSKTFNVLAAEMNTLEEEADKIKRKIRNHLPVGILMAVDKTLFFTYTSKQDNIMDGAQEALCWLAIRPMMIPQRFQAELIEVWNSVAATLASLKPALEGVIGLIKKKGITRAETKDRIHGVRACHRKVFKAKFQLVSAIYNSDTEFKDIHQLFHFVESLHGMSHNAEGCADVLRAMIAR